jgi:hypothetical protein
MTHSNTLLPRIVKSLNGSASGVLKDAAVD